MVSGTPFQLADIEAEWPRIRPLVSGVDPDDNDGEVLRRECRENRALCLISGDGVLVVNLQPDNYGRGELELFVWLAASWSAQGAIQRNEAHLDAIAKELGAVRIVFQSVRPGMRKVLGPQWAVRHTTYERAVNHG